MAKVESSSQLILQQHAELRVMVADLEETLQQPRPDIQDERAESWATGLAEKLLKLHEHVNHHFHEEEASGLLEELAQAFPRSSRSVARLRREHDTIRDELRATLDAAVKYAEGRPLSDPRLRKRTLAILEHLGCHEAEETDLIQSLYNDDLGVGD